MLRHRPSPALVVSCIALVVALGGGAIAAIPDPSGDVHFCYSKKTGNVQVINANTDTVDCQKGWRNFNLDASPTGLESPNGDFAVRVTDSGITAGGAGASVVIQRDGQIKVTSPTNVTIKASGQINLQASQVNQP